MTVPFAPQIGNRFVMSMVPEGKDKMIMRRLARPFKPGEDRLEGLETTPAPLTGAAILKVRPDCRIFPGW